MPGPAPKKNPARRNRVATRAKLSVAEGASVPDLPDGDWHPMTLRWWEDVWASPMASEFLRADEHGLYRLAMLIEDYWRAESATARKDLAGEIRLQGQAFGLTPIDRRRLQWEVEKVEEKAQRKPRKRPASDPRGHLAAVG